MLDVKVDLVGDARALRLHRLGAEEGRDGDEEEAEREPAEDHGVVGSGRTHSPPLRSTTRASVLDHTQPLPVDRTRITPTSTIERCIYGRGEALKPE